MPRSPKNVHEAPWIPTTKDGHASRATSAMTTGAHRGHHQGPDTPDDGARLPEPHCPHSPRRPRPRRARHGVHSGSRDHGGVSAPTRRDRGLTCPSTPCEDPTVTGRVTGGLAVTQKQQTTFRTNPANGVGVQPSAGHTSPPPLPPSGLSCQGQGLSPRRTSHLRASSSRRPRLGAPGRVSPLPHGKLPLGLPFSSRPGSPMSQNPPGLGKG